MAQTRRCRCPEFEEAVEDGRIEWIGFYVPPGWEITPISGNLLTFCPWCGKRVPTPPRRQG